MHIQQLTSKIYVQGKHSIGVLYYLLARMVLQMRGTVTAQSPWDVMVDLFFYREPEEPKEEEAEQEAAPEQAGYGGASGFAAPQGAYLALAWSLHCTSLLDNNLTMTAMLCRESQFLRL